MPVYFCFLVQRNKFKILGISSLIPERTFQSIKIVSSNRGVLTSSTKSVVKFFLGSNEGFVGLLIERNISEDGCGYEWTNLVDLDEYDGTDGSTVMEVVGGVRTTWGGFICCR